MFKLNNKDTITMSGIVLVSSLLNWTNFTSCFSVSIVNFGHVIATWVCFTFLIVLTNVDGLNFSHFPKHDEKYNNIPKKNIKAFVKILLIKIILFVVLFFLILNFYSSFFFLTKKMSINCDSNVFSPTTTNVFDGSS